MEISVIVPALNEEKYIKKTLKSIVAQDFPRKNFELIVSDGASTDNTRKIAKKYADRVVVSKKRGIWWGRNLGAKFAKGKYLVFIDADTVLDRDYLKTVHAYLEKGYVGVSTNYRLSGNGFKIRLFEQMCSVWWYLGSKINFVGTLGFNIGISAKTFKKIGGYKQLPAEDIIMDRDLKKEGRTKFIPRKKVTQSSRRLEKYGVLSHYRYYLETELVGRRLIKNPKNAKWLKNKEYAEVR